MGNGKCLKFEELLNSGVQIALKVGELSEISEYLKFERPEPSNLAVKTKYGWNIAVYSIGNQVASNGVSAGRYGEGARITKSARSVPNK